MTFSEEKAHRCEWSRRSPCLCQGCTKSRWFRAMHCIYIICFPECSDHSIDVIPAILLTSLLERGFQRLLSLVLKWSWLKASGRVKVGSEMQGFWIPCQSWNYLNSKVNKHLISKGVAWCVLRVKIKIFLPLPLQGRTRDSSPNSRMVHSHCENRICVCGTQRKRIFCSPGGAEMSPQLSGHSPFDKNQFRFTWNG